MRRRRRSLFPSLLTRASASKQRRWHQGLQQQQQPCRRRRSLPLRLCGLALLALAALLSLCLLADVAGAALYARAAAATTGGGGGISADARFWDRWEAALLRKAAGGPRTLSLERHWLAAKRDLVARRWRTVAAAAAGSLRSGGGGSSPPYASSSSSPSSSSFLAFPPTLPTFLSSACADLSDDYAPLIAADLRPWPLVTREMVEADPDRLYLVGGRALLPRGADRGRLMPTFHAFLQRLGLRVALPDLVVPLNVADEPRAPWEPGRKWGSEHASGDEAALLRAEGAGADGRDSAAAAAVAATATRSDDEGEKSSSSSSSWWWWPRPLLKKKERGKESGEGKTEAAVATESLDNAVDHHRSSSPSSSSPSFSASSPPPNPLFSFCKTDDYSDILLPNTIEGDVFVRPRDGSSMKEKKEKKKKRLPPVDTAAAAAAAGSGEKASFSLPRVTTATSVTTHRRTRAGGSDPRPATAVWRGSTGGFGGLAKGRAALLRLGQERPDLLDSGVYDWDEARWGHPKGRVKPRMGLADQVDGHK